MNDYLCKFADVKINSLFAVISPEGFYVSLVKWNHNKAWNLETDMLEHFGDDAEVFYESMMP